MKTLSKIYRVKNRTRRLLTLTLSEKQSLYLPPKEEKDLTKAEFESVGVAKAVRSNLLRVIKSPSTGNASPGKDKTKTPGGSK